MRERTRFRWRRPRAPSGRASPKPWAASAMRRAVLRESVSFMVAEDGPRALTKRASLRAQRSNPAAGQYAAAGACNPGSALHQSRGALARRLDCLAALAMTTIYAA